MQGVIERILEGSFDYEGGALDFSCAKLELTLKQGEILEGAFHILSSADRFTDGYVTSSDMRMECLTPRFTGSDAEIGYCFHGEELEEGDVVKGSFSVVSNQGEYSLPFVASVEHAVLNSSVGAVKNLFHFANLAKTDWREAVHLFYSPEFLQILKGNDSQYLDVYRGLSAYPEQEQNVEEFLIHVNKKQKTEYVLQEKEISMDLSDMEGYPVYEKEISLLRNGWGYTRLYIACDGDFLFTEREMLTDDDFLGNQCTLPIFIDSHMCHDGKNFGQVQLYNSYVALTVPVTVSKGAVLSSVHGALTAERILVQIMQYYQSFRLKQMSSGAWLKETERLVEQLVALDEQNPASRLFQAQVLITKERHHEADWILNHSWELMSEQERNGTLGAYYFYLTTLQNRDEEYAREAEAKVRQIYRQDSADWRTAWLLLYLSKEFQKSDSGKWVFLERQFTYGCTSPILYIESLTILNNNPALLRKIGAFELQVLMYGARRHALSGELAMQLVYLCGRVREYSPAILKILQTLYQEREDVTVLQEICVQLIKGGKVGTQYFAWYKAGVEAQLRITNLYEYYMMSLDLNTSEQIPKVVLLYFSYQNHLDYERSAYLYQYILENKNKLEDIYADAVGPIGYFITDQILKCHISRQLAALYKEFLTPAMINAGTAEPLAKLLFAHRLWVDAPGVSQVLVFQEGNLIPARYMLSEGTAWIYLYGDDYTIVFEDNQGNRFTKSVEYTLEKMIFPGKYLEMIAPLVQNCPEFDRYMYEHDREKVYEERVARALRIVASDRVDSESKCKIYLEILHYYYDTDDMRALDTYLGQLPFEALHAEGREEVFKYMVLRGLHSLAYEQIRRYGPYFADAKILMRFLSPLIERQNFAEDTVLTATAEYIFKKGKYDGTILTYLTLYCRGTVKHMRDIWKAARSYEVDCYRLSERILLQMLYSGAFVGEKMDIFQYYVSQGGRQEVEEAFLSQCAYDYFVKEKITEEFIFQSIRKLYSQKGTIHQVCKLAYLKFYAENRKKPDEAGQAIVDIFLQDLAQQKIHLEFLRFYTSCSCLYQDMMDKTIVEYHASPGSRACIHYVLLHENGEAGEYCSEPLREVYGGICFKEFVLFFGESLQYYITEEKNGEEQLTESGTLQKGDSTEPDNSKFRLINDIVISQTMEDYDTLDTLLTEYYCREHYNGRLFELL